MKMKTYLLLFGLAVMPLSLRAGAISGIHIIPSTSLQHLSPWTLDQINDGLAVDADTQPFNGFVSEESSGTITLDLVGDFDLNGFILSNDVNVLSEGIKDFRLDFYDSANALIVSSAVLVAPVRQSTPQTYTFAVVPGASKVDLVVLNCHPTTLNRIEIREVAFLGARIGNNPTTIQSTAYPVIKIAWQSMTGELYQVQVSPSLSPIAWANFGSPVMGDGSQKSVYDPTMNSEKRFYRVAVHTQAALVPLEVATATFSQTLGGGFLVDAAIDGVIGSGVGWAIGIGSGNAGSQTAVFETASDAGFAGGTRFSFKFYQQYNGHTLGRFRLSLTTDDRSLFADGLNSGGDVTANWTVLDIDASESSNGATLTELEDHSILASGFAPNTDLYTVAATTTNTGITGLRLETLVDPSLPFDGPGRAVNGNFVLTELQVNQVSIDCCGPVLSVHVADIQVCWTSRTNEIYQVQYRSELTTNMWVDLGVQILGNGTTNCIIDSVLGEPRGVYRVNALR